MDYRTTGKQDRIGRRSQTGPPRLPRGIFGGNRSVKFGLLAIVACVLFVQIFYQAGDEPLTGPIDDVFRRDPSGLLIVYGTGGESTDSLRDYAHKVSRLLGDALGQDILVYPDTEVDRSLAGDYSLLLYGPVAGNRVTQRMSRDFPFGFSTDTVRAGNLSFAGPDWRLVFAMPNPRNEQRYVLVYTGPTDSSVVGINLLGNPHFVHHDTTDYVLSVGSQIARSGFFDKSNPEKWILQN